MEVTLQFMQCMPSAIQAVAVTGYAASAARFHSMAEQLSLQYISVPKSLVSNLHAMTYRYICCTGTRHTSNCDKHALASSKNAQGWTLLLIHCCEAFVHHVHVWHGMQLTSQG